jgi:hypothetical protein
MINVKQRPVSRPATYRDHWFEYRSRHVLTCDDRGLDPKPVGYFSQNLLSFWARQTRNRTISQIAVVFGSAMIKCPRNKFCGGKFLSCLIKLYAMKTYGGVEV